MRRNNVNGYLDSYNRDGGWRRFFAAYQIGSYRFGHIWLVQDSILDALQTGKDLKTKRKSDRMSLYKEIFPYCVNPDCPFGYGSNCHHIIPLSKGGTDSYNNYITLCAQCHRFKGLHSKYTKTQIKYLTLKFYVEQIELGTTSADVSNEEFNRLLREAKARKTTKAPR